MKKILTFSVLATLVFSTMSPLSACYAQDDGGENATTMVTESASTSLTASTGGGSANEAPFVKAKWEMDGPYATMGGLDDNVVAGAQFNPSGGYRVDKTISLCAIATDSDGLSDIDSVYGDVFYPNVGIHEGTPVPGNEGCGKMVGTECRMMKLTKENGLSLFCDKIRNKNTNLPVFSEEYDYDEICKADGELQKETAAVYCCDKPLSYEDPSGDYTVKAFAQDKFGVSSDPLVNTFTYQSVTSFETDFNSIAYGNVKLNTHKIINGDLVWAATKGINGASIRNTGNTRVQIGVLQDDMGLGKTGTAWNVAWDARIGNNAADWTVYAPYAMTWLKKVLNLSETNEMDFSVDISKFALGTGPNYTGDITLNGVEAAHLTCVR
jgi:hypothetical protein